jgi:hypothetical protein
LALGEQVELPS